MKKRVFPIILALVLVVSLIGGAVASESLAFTYTVEPDAAVTVTLDGEELELKNALGESVVPVLVDGTTYVPIRAISENLGYDVDWVQGDKEVVIRTEKVGFSIDPSQPISVEGGQITGALTDDGEVAVWKGIPYAAPPVGDLRWKVPQPVPSWSGVKACTEFGPSAMQGMEGAFGTYTDEFLNANRNYSEDCLYMNIWAPAEAPSEGLPVIFYIHGGGFTSGGGSVPIYSGEEIARKDVVFVNINYRLGVFGFMSHPELSAENENGVSGNQALYDWVKGLEWVRDYISEFGGDPNNVTIMGQSAGASAIKSLTISPLASGLFHKAFIMSGGGLGSTNPGSNNLAQAEERGKAFFDAQGKTLAEMRAMSAEELLAVGSSMGTVIDGYSLVDSMGHSLLTGTDNDVPVIIGIVGGDAGGGVIDTTWNPTYMSADEYELAVRDAFGDQADTVLALYPVVGNNALPQAKALNRDRSSLMDLMNYGRAKGTNSENPAFIYYYTHDYANVAEKGPFHSSDIPYWLGGGSLFSDEHTTWTEVDQKLADTMSDYLVNFAYTGDVNGDNVPYWAPADGNMTFMMISEYAATGSIDMAKQLFWEADAEARGAAVENPFKAPEEEAPEGPARYDVSEYSDKIKIEAGEATNTAMVYEFAAGAWNPVSTSGAYASRAWAEDANGNRLGSLTITNSLCDYSEYAGTIDKVVVQSSFYGVIVEYKVP